MGPDGRRGVTLALCGIAVLLLQIAILVILLTHKLPMAALSLFLVGPAILVLMGVFLRAAAKREKKPEAGKPHLDSR